MLVNSRRGGKDEEEGKKHKEEGNLKNLVFAFDYLKKSIFLFLDFLLRTVLLFSPVSN